MSRETENALLLLVGLSTAIITITGTYTRYVKSSLLVWLAGTAVLLIGLALVAIVRDIRHGSGDHDGHTHRSAVAWLLVAPIGLLGFVVPPPISPEAARPSVTNVSTDVLRRPYPPLPAERAPTLSLPELLARVWRDSAGTLDDRLITVTGFVMQKGDHTELGRVVIICCAADASLARIRLAGPAAAQIASYPDNTWLKVEGKVPSGQGDSTRRTTPLMEVYRAEPTKPPDNTYAY
jgi:uncharacterized repeat protein (TIGR03943 family)